MSRKIIGVTVGTTQKPQAIIEHLKADGNFNSGITAPVNGFFTMVVEEDGNLYAISAEDGTTPDFEYDSDTGNLYVLQGDVKTLIGNVKGAKGDDGSDANVTLENILLALGYIPANETHEHSAENITSGILPLARGGTGASLAFKANGIVRFSSNGSKMSSTATANGAFYATASNGAPKFGTLPIAQGGTGATTAEAVLTNLGITATVEELNNLSGSTGNIQTLIQDIATKLTHFLNVDDTTVDELSEVLQLIEDNKGTLESLTISKINVSAIVDNLATSDSTKVLSAKQGVAIKSLIDALQTVVDGKMDEVTSKDITSALGYTPVNETQLNKKANDYSIEIYNGTSGNPKPVKFMTVNYSTCGSENGVAIKVSMVSGHGNGSSYAFLQDAIIKVTHAGVITVDNFKYYGASAGTYDGASRQYGDIFWVHDTTNKIVDFYCLMGQYSRVQMTPYKRVTYSTGGVITQYTSATVYSTGDKVWGNNDEFALLKDIPAVPSNTETWTFTLQDGSTVTKKMYVG